LFGMGGTASGNKFLACCWRLTNNNNFSRRKVSISASSLLMTYLLKTDVDRRENI
jgi:hypothetical protein